MITATRAANLQDMVDILEDQRARRHDVVVSSDKLQFEEGHLILKGFDGKIEDDGVVTVDGSYTTADIFDRNLATRINIPPDFLRQLHYGKGEIVPRPDLYDQLVNGYLHGRRPKIRLADGEILRAGIDADPRLFLLRLFVTNDGTQNVARALLSNRFAVMDNLDALLSMLQGMQEAGIDPSTLTISGDLSETRMYIKVGAPEIFTLAPELLRGYNNPFSDPNVDAQRVDFQRRMELGAAYNEGGRAALAAAGGDTGTHGGVTMGHEPIVHAGFVLSNSEVGMGKYSITPSITVLACANGMLRTKEALERTHLGATLEQGTVEWSTKTMQRNVDLISSMSADAVRSFLSKGFLDRAVAEITEKATRSLGAKPREVVETVLKKVAFDETAIHGILDHFMIGRQMTSGGILQAITSYSQTVESADEAYELDSRAIQAMEHAYAISR